MDSPQDSGRQALAADASSQPATSSVKRLLQSTENSLDRVPALRRVPVPALAIIVLIALINVAVWVGVAIILVNPESSRSLRT